MFYNFKFSQNAVEATKIICCTKNESMVDYSTVTRWLKKFSSGCKNFNDQARSGRPKTVDSKVGHEVTEANLESKTQLRISQIHVVCYLHDLSKSIQKNC